MTSSSSGYSVSDLEDNKRIHVVDITIPFNLDKKTSSPLNLKIESLNRMTRRKSTPVLYASGVQVYEDDTEKDDNHEDNEERDENVVPGRMMFVSNVNSDLYENTKFFKMFGRNDSPGDGYEVVIVKRDNSTKCKRRNLNSIFKINQALR